LILKAGAHHIAACWQRLRLYQTIPAPGFQRDLVVVVYLKNLRGTALLGPTRYRKGKCGPAEVRLIGSFYSCEEVEHEQKLQQQWTPSSTG
jgi:hypothetical protein